MHESVSIHVCIYKCIHAYILFAFRYIGILKDMYTCMYACVVGTSVFPDDK